jgi:FkbM family methyltransferase
MKHFFDIGGNIGQTFDWLQTLPHNYNDYTIWVFEPSPRHHAQLIEKCKQMSSIYNIKLCPFGIGAHTGTARFYEKDDLLGDSFESYIASDHEVTNINQGYEVIAPIVSLTDFIYESTSENDEIVLDIDTEGSEYPILNSLLRDITLIKRIKKIIVEFHYIKDRERFMTKKQYEDAFAKAGIDLTIRGFFNDKD